MTGTVFSGTVLLDNVRVVAKEIQNTWVKYENEIYYVFSTATMFCDIW